MKLGGILRVVALGCIVASAPVGLLKYPWLPATFMEFSELRHEPASWATESYRTARAQRLERLEIALALYALGTVALCGLWAVVADLLPRRVEVAAWLVAAVAGLGVAWFERPGIGPGTVPVYIWVTIYLPCGIAATAMLAAVVRVLAARSGTSR